jgi:hypothetical protein
MISLQKLLNTEYRLASTYEEPSLVQPSPHIHGTINAQKSASCSGLFEEGMTARRILSGKDGIPFVKDMIEKKRKGGVEGMGGMLTTC